MTVTLILQVKIGNIVFLKLHTFFLVENRHESLLPKNSHGSPNFDTAAYTIAASLSENLVHDTVIIASVCGQRAGAMIRMHFLAFSSTQPLYKSHEMCHFSNILRVKLRGKMH